MNRNLLFLPIFIMSLLFISSGSQADVLIFDIESDIRFSSQAAFNSGTIETGSSSVGDYILIACAVVDPNEANVFLPPSPGAWAQLDNGICGGDFSCIGGIWGSFTDNPNSQEITCNWSEDNFVFAAGSMRFSGVDAENPIIDVACNTGSGDSTATAPSINTEAGSNVVRIYTFNPLTVPNIEPSTFTNIIPELGPIQYDSRSLNTFQIVGSNGQSEFFADAGPTGTEDLMFTEAPISWRACTIGLRMGTPPPFASSVPTMSEWGLIGFAAFAGIAGFWFIRRRQLAA